MKGKAEIIGGKEFKDERGKLIFFNEFDMAEVKRFYVIEHPNVETVRAWQGHKTEQKWFYVIDGGFKIALVKPDNWENPSRDLKPEEFVLKADDNRILHIPGGWANGFKALEANSRLMIFSDFSIADAGKDDHRFEKDLWFEWQ